VSPLRFVVLVIVLAALVAGIFALATPPPAERCQAIDADRVSRGKVTALTAEGWHPIAGDNAERLYSPGCLTPGSGV
jgi:uncharacterized protein YbjT (DUF2867 family)